MGKNLWIALGAFCCLLLAGCGDTTSGQDMMSGDAGLKALCETCTADTECTSGTCASYMMGTIKKCSHSCAAATASADCPGIDACSGMNICKCPN